MITYQQVYNSIKAALTGRTPGTQVQVPDHEAAEILILDYIEQVNAGTFIREAHDQAAADQNTDLIWSSPYPDTNYTSTIEAWDALGNPAPVYLRGKQTTKIIVMTIIDSTIYAISRPFNS